LPYVIFGTYASSARIATAQKKAGVPAFDLVVADEAHRIAGAVGKTDKGERAQRVVLDEKGIRAERRLFATATPRVYGGDRKKDGEEIVLESMDDPARFGEEVYKLTFQQAVDLDRLVPYKLLVTIVTDKEVEALIRDRAYLDVDGKKISTDDLATAIAVRRAYTELGISRVISYHGSIKRARAFAELVQAVKAPGKAPEAECVTGSMAVEDRKEALTRLAQAEGPYLITNARCLTEGIDVPALDAVAFADPRRSQVDIVQAVGRAMRKPRGTSSKTTGYVILPVFLSKADLKDPEAAVEGSAFAPVLQVLRALKAHDPYRATFFAQILVEQGKRPHKKGEGIDEILQVSIGKSLDEALVKRLEEAVQLRVMEVAKSPFDFWHALLEEFVKREGHALVPARHVENGRKLGDWVSTTVRMHKERFTIGQIAQLDSLGFNWDPYEAQFRTALEALRVYVAREGNALVPKTHKEGDVGLGSWVSALRMKKIRLSPERIAALDAAGFIWNRHNEFNQIRLVLLQQYVKRVGNALVPQAHIENGVKLGSWVLSLRQRKSEYDPALINELDQLGFSWNPLQETFMRNLALLQAYAAREGHILVPQSHVESGFRLGVWANRIRRSRLHGSLTQEQIEALDEIKFVWKPADHIFIRDFAVLRTFVQREGHANVPYNHLEGKFRLGGWVREARRRKDRFAPAALNALDSLGFIWELPDGRFEQFYGVLQEYVAREGHARVPDKFRERGIGLGSWIGRLRQNKEKLSEHELRELDALGFVWNPFRETFDRNLKLLEAFREREGHCRVPRGHTEGGVNLASWVHTIRGKKKSLGADRIAQLDLLGFSWDPFGEVFERNLALLKLFVAREGHAAVPQKHIEGGIKLGLWVSGRRAAKERMSAEEILRLEQVGFIWGIKK
jgi:hypothetical protein